MERKGSSRTEEIDDYVHRVMTSSFLGAPGKLEAVTIEQVREATDRCPEMQKLKKAIRSGNFEDPTLRRYRERDVNEALHVTEHVIYRGRRVVIPEELRRRVVKLSHRGHQGIAKTKKLLREFCWFPNIDQLVDKCFRAAYRA